MSPQYVQPAVRCLGILGLSHLAKKMPRMMFLPLKELWPPFAAVMVLLGHSRWYKLLLKMTSAWDSFAMTNQVSVDERTLSLVVVV